MQGARMLGNYVSKLAEENRLTQADLSRILNCSETQVRSFIKGRFFVSYPQLMALAKVFNVSINDLLKGDSDSYNATVVHYMREFKNPVNRESILDIIDNYLDIKNAVE